MCEDLSGRSLGVIDRDQLNLFLFIHGSHLSALQRSVWNPLLYPSAAHPLPKSTTEAYLSHVTLGKRIALNSNGTHGPFQVKYQQYQRQQVGNWDTRNAR